MTLPFTVDQFFGVFAAYNQAFWMVAVLLWLASATVLVAAWRVPARRSSSLSGLLAALWLWGGIGYHAVMFTRINPAAWAFAALFVVQGGLLLWRRPTPTYFSAPGMRQTIGLGLACYGLAYPILSVLLHDYPAAPTFGVPCPTAILTMGVLMTVRDVRTRTLAIIPVLWGFVGGSAAILLDVRLDYVLLGAAVLLATTMIVDSRDWAKALRVH